MLGYSLTSSRNSSRMVAALISARGGAGKHSDTGDYSGGSAGGGNPFAGADLGGFEDLLGGLFGRGATRSRGRAGLQSSSSRHIPRILADLRHPPKSMKIKVLGPVFKLCVVAITNIFDQKNKITKKNNFWALETY